MTTAKTVENDRKGEQPAMRIPRGRLRNTAHSGSSVPASITALSLTKNRGRCCARSSTLMLCEVGLFLPSYLPGRVP
jgi:hypothetical protein